MKFVIVNFIRVGGFEIFGGGGNFFVSFCLCIIVWLNLLVISYKYGDVKVIRLSI